MTVRQTTGPIVRDNPISYEARNALFAARDARAKVAVKLPHGEIRHLWPRYEIKLGGRGWHIRTGKRGRTVLALRSFIRTEFDDVTVWLFNAEAED
jgi:hypothetical protein